jgi:hypothetical protein
MILFVITFLALTGPGNVRAVSRCLTYSMFYTVSILVALVVKACESNTNSLRNKEIRAEKYCDK